MKSEIEKAVETIRTGLDEKTRELGEALLTARPTPRNGSYLQNLYECYENLKDIDDVLRGKPGPYVSVFQDGGSK